MMMLVLVLCPVIMFSACSSDDDEVDSSNTFVIDGKKYTVDYAEFDDDSKDYALHYGFVGSLKEKIGFEFESIEGLGAFARASIECESGNGYYHGYVRDVKIYFTKEGNNVTIKFDNLEFKDGDKTHICSLNYTGPYIEAAYK